METVIHEMTGCFKKTFKVLKVLLLNSLLVQILKTKWIWNSGIDDMTEVLKNIKVLKLLILVARLVTWVDGAVNETELQVLEHNSLLGSSSNLLSGESVVLSIIVHLGSWVIVELVPRVPVLVGWSPQEPLAGLVNSSPLGLGLLLLLSVLLLLGSLLLSVDVGGWSSGEGLSHVVHHVPSSHGGAHLVDLVDCSENFFAVLFVALWVHGFPESINNWLVGRVHLVSASSHLGDITGGVSEVLFPSKVLQLHWEWHGEIKLDSSSSG